MLGRYSLATTTKPGETDICR